MIDIKARVVRNQFLGGRLYLMEVHAPEIAKRAKGGQFVMVKGWNSLEPMGRRAFAIGDVRGENVLIFYDLIGRGTYLMSTLREGDEISVFGPLGNGLFDHEGERHLLLGGGVGLAGLSLFGKELRAMGKKVVFVYAGRNKEHLGMEGWLKEEGFDYILYTEDGSKGRKGLITEVLREFDTSWKVSACGPKGMLKALKSLKSGHSMQFSLEARMACGWGVCLGCVVRNSQGKYVRVCYEGPVFDAQEVTL